MYQHCFIYCGMPPTPNAQLCDYKYPCSVAIATNSPSPLHTHDSGNSLPEARHAAGGDRCNRLL